MGSPEEGARFLDKRWPEARAVSDQDKQYYEAFGLKRGSASQLFGPKVWMAGLSSLRHGLGRPVGDPWVLAGSFVVVGPEVVAADVAQNTASMPDLDQLAAVARSAASA